MHAAMRAWQKVKKEIHQFMEDMEKMVKAQQTVMEHSWEERDCTPCRMNMDICKLHQTLYMEKVLMPKKNFLTGCWKHQSPSLLLVHASHQLLPEEINFLQMTAWSTCNKI